MDDGKKNKKKSLWKKYKIVRGVNNKKCLKKKDKN
jgi:hypothetical protein